MATQKDSERPAAIVANLTTAVFWVVVDKLGASVKVTVAQMQTAIGAITSVVGDVTAALSGGVATTTIGALKVATGMIQAAAVTYAKIQNVSAPGMLLGRDASGSGSPAEQTVSGGLAIASGVLEPSAANKTYLSPTKLSGTLGVSGSAAFADASGLSFTVAASTAYAFEFFILHDGAARPKFAVTAPSSPTRLYYEAMYWQNGATTIDGTVESSRATTNDGTVGGSLPNDSGDMHFATVKGILVNGSNAGSIQLRYGLTSVGGTLTLQDGSYGVLTQLA